MQPRDLLVRITERLIGRRQMIRISRFVLNHARRDGPNQIERNGELIVQREALAAAGDRAVVFDVGANVGQWSTHLLQQNTAGLNLHVFEPAARCVERLRQRLPVRPAVTITINQHAISSKDGEATLFKPHELAGSSSLHQGSLTDGGDVLRESVRIGTLDTYASERGIAHIDLLKIDTEGHDYLVLLGAIGLLQRGEIGMVQFEYNHRWIAPRHFLKDVFDLVTPIGYQVGKVTPHGIEWYPAWTPQLETFIEGNYVAARPTVAKRLPAVRWWAETKPTGRFRR